MMQHAFSFEAPRAPVVRRPDRKMAEKLRGLAACMDGEISHKFSDRLTNTPKRMREAGSARLDGVRLQRTQAALRALADLHDAGDVPAALRAVTSKKRVWELVATKIERNGGYYDCGTDTGVPYSTTPEATALWALLQPRSAEEQKAEALRQKIAKLQFANIPGYFPTPRDVVQRMISFAHLPYVEPFTCRQAHSSGATARRRSFARGSKSSAAKRRSCRLALSRKAAPVSRALWF